MKDTEATSLSNDFIVNFIHSFRIQIFFMVAGFFGAMLFYERTPLMMVKNRISRIILPFITFMLILWPTMVFTFGYIESLFGGSKNPLADKLELFSSIEIIIP